MTWGNLTNYKHKTTIQLSRTKEPSRILKLGLLVLTSKSQTKVALRIIKINILEKDLMNLHFILMLTHEDYKSTSFFPSLRKGVWPYALMYPNANIKYPISLFINFSAKLKRMKPSVSTQLLYFSRKKQRRIE